MKNLYLLFILFFASCEKLLVGPGAENNPEENFEVLWNTVNEKYSYFELKRINWDSIYTVYRPKVTSETNQVDLFYTFSDMLYTLRDGHTNLFSGFDVSRNWEWYLNYPVNFNYDVIERNYLGPNHLRTGPFQSIIIDSVGYVYYESFGLNFSESQWAFVLRNFEDYKGVIIDVRHNGGGSILNAAALAAPFVNEKTLVGYDVFKNGSGKSDFTSPIPKYINPSEFKFNKKVVVLTNRKCYSATNDFVLFMKAAGATLLGDTTGGGGGLPIDYELPNGWSFRFSASKTLDLDNKEIELGISPDVALNIPNNAALQGRDTYIEAAIGLFP